MLSLSWRLCSPLNSATEAKELEDDDAEDVEKRSISELASDSQSDIAMILPLISGRQGVKEVESASLDRGTAKRDRPLEN